MLVRGLLWSSPIRPEPVESADQIGLVRSIVSGRGNFTRSLLLTHTSTSSSIAVTPGTGSSASPGQSCRSGCATGLMSANQCDLVLADCSPRGLAAPLLQQLGLGAFLDWSGHGSASAGLEARQRRGAVARRDHALGHAVEHLMH